ncbi:MAG: NADP-dependent phosphogluconate dehydrogenase [bacterium]
MQAKADAGIIGLAVMGQNLALNIESRGFTTAVFNRTAERTREFVGQKCAGRRVLPAYTLPSFVASLQRPRRIILMVKAGAAVDETLRAILPRLERGDVVMDGGNSHFRDTERRQAEVQARKLDYLGCGISGGEYGALHGPSIMPGGERAAYGKLARVLTAIAARTEDGACCTYLGAGSAGHFVKMVHNGIEYAMMQTVAEVFDVMQRGWGLSTPEAQRIFFRWNQGTNKLNGYLVEITAVVLKKTDPETGRPLVDLIQDRAEQKGTGKWTSQAALDLGVPVPTITAAVDARIVSGHKADRVRIARRLGDPERRGRAASASDLKRLESGLHAAFLIAYAQGMHLLARASAEKRYGLNLAEVARIWKGGCIIRSRILTPLKRALAAKPGHLFESPLFARLIRAEVPALRAVVRAANAAAIPVPCLGSALAYYDGFRRARLPANLIQAQRDHFGAHTYERTDREGTFHTQWE